MCKSATVESSLFPRRLAKVTAAWILGFDNMTEQEATFSLLDQRTVEYQWAAVEKLPKFQQSGHKIELFYFLANSWLDRALHAKKDFDVLAAQWGRDDWVEVRSTSRDERRDVSLGRFKLDLGYRSVQAWPIYERENAGAVTC